MLFCVLNNTFYAVHISYFKLIIEFFAESILEPCLEGVTQRVLILWIPGKEANNATFIEDSFEVSLQV